MKKIPQKYIYRILSKGGVLTPSTFAEVLDLALKAGNESVFLGSRQDILFAIENNSLLPEFETKGINIQKRSSGLQNVVSSFACVDILPSTAWVHSGTFLKVLDQFSFNHQLRVNIVDPKQNMVPLFYGQLNFIASEIPNYWHLYLNLQSAQRPEQWPGLIFTDDIAEFAHTLEHLILQNNISKIQDLMQQLEGSELQKNTLNKESGIILPKGFFPYYEGLNKIDCKEQYWAGFYWRNNQYPIRFLLEVCDLCMKTNVGKICFTPWKTFLINGIDSKDKKYWDELIGRYGINMRHSSFELNWHLPLFDVGALRLKRYLVSKFDKFDIRTFGLSFAIQNELSGNFTTVVIRTKSRLSFLGKFDFTKTYSIDYAYDFNPNSNDYIQYAGNLNKNQLPAALNDLSKRYYSLQFIQKAPEPGRKQQKNAVQKVIVHQCSDCGTIYDERFGDETAKIAKGISFQQLPANYCCQLCDAPKETFTTIEINDLITT